MVTSQRNERLLSGVVHMAAMLRRMRSKHERLRDGEAATLRDALLPFERDIPKARELIAHIDREIAARNGWTFIMISADQNRAVVRWLRTNSRRPMCAATLWAELFSAVDRDTGEIMLTRDQLAELTGIASQHVTNIMSELEGIGAIIKRRERVVGMRGPGMVRYFMNPVVGTHLAGRERDTAQAEAPPGPLLRVMEGGKANG